MSHRQQRRQHYLSPATGPDTKQVSDHAVEAPAELRAPGGPDDARVILHLLAGPGAAPAAAEPTKAAQAARGGVMAGLGPLADRRATVGRPATSGPLSREVVLPPTTGREPRRVTIASR